MYLKKIKKISRDFYFEKFCKNLGNLISRIRRWWRFRGN